MHEFPLHPVFENIKANAHITEERYKAMYDRSINDADNFWTEMANEFLVWDQPFTKVTESDFNTGEAKSMF